MYLDLVYIPNHSNSKNVDVEFFKRVRSSYYVVSGNDAAAEEPSRAVLDSLLEGKAQWESNMQVGSLLVFLPGNKNFSGKQPCKARAALEWMVDAQDVRFPARAPCFTSDVIRNSSEAQSCNILSRSPSNPSDLWRIKQIETLGLKGYLAIYYYAIYNLSLEILQRKKKVNIPQFE